jgi:signal transduction histidine kinase
VDPLFLGVYLRLLAGLLVATALFLGFVVPRVDRHVSRNVERSMGASLGVIAEQLASEVGRDLKGGEPPTLAVVRRWFNCPAELTTLSALTVDEHTRARVEKGESVIASGSFDWTFLVRVPGTDSVLSVGPVVGEHPMAKERGPLIMAALLIGLLVGAYLLLSPIKRRLARLAAAADAFRRGRLHSRSDDDQKTDAIGQLGASFNRMADELQRLFASQQELLRTVSHEFRTPIQRIHFALEVVRESPDETERRRGFERVDSALDELDRLIAELLTYVRLGEPGTPRLSPRANVELGALVELVASTLDELKGDVRLEIHRSAESPLVAMIEERILERAVSNLLLNAIRHAKTKVEAAITRSGDQLIIDIDDDGPGIPPEERLRVFEPFHRLDRDRERKGFGLGLAIVRRVAEAHGGRVEAHTSPLGGARLRLLLPAASPLAGGG